MDILADPNSINDEPVENTSKGESTGGSGWNGMTIKDILEKVDLFNFAMISHEEDKKEKEANSITNMSDEKVRQYNIVSFKSVFLISPFFCGIL